MKRFQSVSCRLALTMILALMLPSPAHAQRYHAADMASLVEVLEAWLDANAPWPRRTNPPTIRRLNTDSNFVRQHRNASNRSMRRRGLYDPDTQTIYLISPWDSFVAQDVSVLLHELVHHRQAVAGHWYCPGAQELPAYRLQEKWLNEQGLQGNIDWIAVVLEAGCTPKDIHPN
jgi:hypothetical protein